MGLVIQLACLWLTTYLLGLHGKLTYNVALVTGIALATLFRYWSYKTWVWRAQPPSIPVAGGPGRSLFREPPPLHDAGQYLSQGAPY